MNIFPLYPQQVMDMWPLLMPFVDLALQHTHGEMSALDVCERGMNGAMQIWIVADAERVCGTVVTEVVEFPQLTTLRIVTLAGDNFKEWRVELDQIMEQFARVVGAKRIEAVGRPGWVRALRDLDYKPAYVIVVRDVPELASNQKETIHEQVGRNN